MRESFAAIGGWSLIGTAMNVFLAFVVLAGSALSLFLINLQTVPVALSAAAAAAVLVRTLIQKPAIWVPLTAALLV